MSVADRSQAGVMPAVPDAPLQRRPASFDSHAACKLRLPGRPDWSCVQFVTALACEMLATVGGCGKRPTPSHVLLHLSNGLPASGPIPGEFLCASAEGLVQSQQLPKRRLARASGGIKNKGSNLAFPSCRSPMFNLGETRNEKIPSCSGCIRGCWRFRSVFCDPVRQHQRRRCTNQIFRRCCRQWHRPQRC